MNPSEIDLVQDSFRKIARIAPQAAALFFARLFELDPALRELFAGDMHEQGRKLMATMATAVASLDRLDALVPTLRAFGAGHVDQRVSPEHCEAVGTALLWTLEKGLGGDFTPAVRAAWTRTYSFLADTMIEAQREICVA